MVVGENYSKNGISKNGIFFKKNGTSKNYFEKEISENLKTGTLENY